MLKVLARVVVLVIAIIAPAAPMQAGEGIDLDAWHHQLAEAVGETWPEDEPQVPAFGLYPAVGAALGPPNWASVQASAYLLFTDGKHFSIFGGYGIERGPQADARVVTLGWGGLTPLHVASKRLGFHGKFLRYRRWDGDDHGLHHGLSFGTESGVGNLGLAFEVGAARSNRNHWLFTAQVVFKVAVPVRIPLRRGAAEPRE